MIKDMPAIRREAHRIIMDGRAPYRHSTSQVLRWITERQDMPLKNVGRPTKLSFFRQLAEKWKHRNDKFVPGHVQYVGHKAAKAAGKAKCTCAEHGTWDLGDGKLTDIMCPFHGR